MKQETLKKIIELADGFEAREDSIRGFLYLPNKVGISFDYLKEDKTIYSLILRRAVEGWNEKHESIIYDVLGIHSLDNDKVYEYSNYTKTEYLTPQEQAIEACLVELLEGK